MWCLNKISEGLRSGRWTQFKCVKDAMIRVEVRDESRGRTRWIALCRVGGRLRSRRHAVIRRRRQKSGSKA